KAKNEAVAANTARAAVQEPTVAMFRGVLLRVDDELRKKASLIPLRRKIIEILMSDYAEVRKASAKFPNPIEDRTDAIGYMRLADVLMRMNEVAAAGELYDKAALIHARLAREDPGHPAHTRNLAIAFIKQGDGAL